MTAIGLPSRHPDSTSVSLPSAAEPVAISPEPEASAISSSGRIQRRGGLRGDEEPRPATLPMDDRVEAVDHQLDYRWRLGTFSTRIVDTCGQARKMCRWLWRQAVHAPGAATVVADLQTQGHGQPFNARRYAPGPGHIAAPRCSGRSASRSALSCRSRPRFRCGFVVGRRRQHGPTDLAHAIGLRVGVLRNPIEPSSNLGYPPSGAPIKGAIAG